MLTIVMRTVINDSRKNKDRRGAMGDGEGIIVGAPLVGALPHDKYRAGTRPAPTYLTFYQG